MVLYQLKTNVSPYSSPAYITAIRKQLSCFLILLGTTAVSPIQFHKETVVFSNIYPLSFKEGIHSLKILLNYKCFLPQRQFTPNNVEIPVQFSAGISRSVHCMCLKQNLLCCWEYLMGCKTEHIS